MFRLFVPRVILAAAPVLFSAGLGFAVERTATPGWENANPLRKEFPPAKVVWTAPADGFAVVREDGAEGGVTVTNGEVRIRKTNGLGRIVVTAPEFAVEKGRGLRFFADVEARTDDPNHAGGHLAAWSTVRSVTAADPFAPEGFGFGGHHMRQLVNSAPATPYRKFRHLVPDSGRATAAIVVEGAPSESVWRHLAADDLAAAQAKWDAHYARLFCPDRSADRQDADAFAAALAADTDHTAKIERRDGVAQLVVDGEVRAPILYKECEWSVENRIIYAGKPLQEAGVRIGVLNLRLGDLGFANFRGPWSANGFDVKAAVETVRNAMRVGDKSLFILALGTSAYPAFTEREHPDEVWIREDGKPAFGNSGSVRPELGSDGGKPDPGDRRWPWVSPASPSWRAAIRRMTAELFAELKRTGLMKRVIGVHYYGYHDGQFAMPIPDCSPCAKAEYARYLAEKGLTADDPAGSYAFFSKQLGFRALEDFSREAKRLAGKPIVACKWEMGPLDVSFDVGGFLASDAVDVLVPQADYLRRLPGLAQMLNVPTASLHDRGKMLWMELDLRTWAATDRWADSLPVAKGLNTAEDIEMWRTLFRKNAGMLLASRMGWWMYDMGGGWFSPAEIVEDFKSVWSVRQRLAESSPDPWHPEVAFVLDELALGTYNAPRMPKVEAPARMTTLQWIRNAEAGVPCESRLAADFEERPELLKRYKAVLLAGFVQPSARQRRLLAAFAGAGVKALVLPGKDVPAADVNAFARSAGAFVAARPGVLQIDMNGDFLSVHCLVPGTHEVKLPFRARVVNLKDGSSVRTDILTLTLTAGETCWFLLSRTGLTSPPRSACLPVPNRRT